MGVQTCIRAVPVKGPETTLADQVRLPKSLTGEFCGDARIELRMICHPYDDTLKCYSSKRAIASSQYATVSYDQVDRSSNTLSMLHRYRYK